MPLTNLPESGPPKVFASSIDSLMAAFNGTLGKYESSNVAIRRRVRSTLAIWSRSQLLEASASRASISCWCSCTPWIKVRAKSTVSGSAFDSAAWYSSARSRSPPPSLSSSNRTLSASSRARWRRPIRALGILGEPHVADEHVDLPHFEAEHLVDGVRHLALNFGGHGRDVRRMVDDDEQLDVQRIVAHFHPDALIGGAGRQQPMAVAGAGRIHAHDPLDLTGGERRGD